MIKDNDLIHKIQEDSDTNTTTYVLKNLNKKNNKTKLGEVFNFLPPGIINKTVTGIGGTSLELDAVRDSIIVEPYVMTAFNKAQSASRNNSFKIHFYGKAPKSIKQKLKLSIKDIITKLYSENADEELYKYIDYCKLNNQSMKIICVADQLESLKINLTYVDSDYFDTFHLIFDEIDCFQSSSSYRNIMDRCLEIYKIHPTNKRTLLSATMSTFSDTELKDEPKTKIIYKDLEYDDLSIAKILPSSFSNEILSILENLQNNPKTNNDKILIACNNMDLCLKTIKLLESKKFNNIKILCSEERQDSIEKYYDVIPSSGNLPGKINFITSRYFNGIDILEKYHSIIIARGNKPNLRLSPSVIYQINGRGRCGLISRTLLYNLKITKEQENNTYETLNEQALELCQAYEFMYTLKTSKYPNNVKAIEELIRLLETGNKNFYSLCYKNLKGEFIPSNLKIDARLEEESIINVYKNNKFIESLEKWYKIKNQSSLAKGVNTNQLNTPLEDAENIIKKMLEFPNLNSDKIFEKIYLDNPGIKTIAKIYELARSSSDIDFIKLKNVCIKAASSKYYKKEIKKLLLNMEIQENVIKKNNSLSKSFKKFFEVSNNPKSKTYLKETCLDWIKIAEEIKVPLYQQNVVKLLSSNKSIFTEAILDLKEKKERTSSLKKNKTFQTIKSNKPVKQIKTIKIIGYKKLDIFTD